MVADPPERIIVLMRKRLVARIEDFRFARRIPSRGEAIRRLIEAGLKAMEAEPPADNRP